MTEAEVIAEISAFLATSYLGGDASELAPETPLLKLGILDSLRMVALIAFMEEKFGIAIDGDDVVAANFKTLRSIAGLVVRLREPGAGTRP